MVVWAITAAFGTYFCMYAFRKPFTAASYSGESLWGVDFKTVLVAAQVAGYTVSKFVGIRVIAEMKPSRRAVAILALIGFAELSLVAFGLLPRPWNAVALFFNGLPLGMVFGLVLGFLEGRRLTEAMTAGLCASFILADGVVKSVGAWLLKTGISEDWMPATAGAMFVPLVLVGVWMLGRLPAPSSRDIEARARRTTMSRGERLSLLGRYALGLGLLTLMYLILTIVRSVRADFATELWQGLGEPAAPATFSESEILVALGVLLVSGGTVLVRDNRTAFCVSMATCVAGALVLAGSLFARNAGVISPFAFMTLTGLGMYLPYVAMNTTVFERMLAMTRAKGNMGFLMYVVDSIGYLGYVGVIVFKGTTSLRGDMLGLFVMACWLAAGASGLCALGSWAFFASRAGEERAQKIPAVVNRGAN